MPTHNDNVVFGSDSFNNNYTVTIEKDAYCADLTIGQPSSGAVTLAGSSSLNIFGSLSIASGVVRTYDGIVAFKATSTGKTITTNSVAFASAFSFQGYGGGWTLQDNLNIGTGALTLTRGSLDTNGKSVTCAAFSSTNLNTRSLTLGASAITCASLNFGTPDGLTFDCGTSVITMAAGTLTGGNQIFYEVVFTGLIYAISGNNTFTNLTRTGTAAFGNNLVISGNQTITGTLTLNGNSSIYRLLVGSSVRGTSKTLTAATVVCSNADFQDITGAGAGSWNLAAITGLSGDCGGNSGITLTSPSTQTWNGTTGGNWSANAWSGHMPLPQDTADLGIAWTASKTVTQDSPRIGTVTFTGATGTPTWTTSTNASCYGSITLISGMVLTASSNAYTIEGRGSYTITSGTLTWAKAFNFNAPGSTYTIQDAFNLGANGVSSTGGTLDTNGQTITCSSFSLTGAFTRTVTLGASTINTGSWTNSATSTNLTFNCGTSVIKCSTGNFTGGGLTYYEVQLNGENNALSDGGNTFTNLTRTGTTTKTCTLLLAGDQIVTGTFTANGNSYTARLLLGSGTNGTRRKITAATVVASYIDIQDIEGAGAGSWNLSACTGLSGDGGNNSGITFTTAIPCYWVADSANWSTTANWKTTSGGGTQARIPLLQDTATFDGASFTTTGRTVTGDVARIGAMDCTLATNSPTINFSSTFDVYGSVTIISGMTFGTDNIIFKNRSNVIFTTASKSYGGNFYLRASAKVTIVGDLTYAGTFNIETGEVDLQNNNASCTFCTVSDSPLNILTMGSGTFTCTSAGNIWSMGNQATFNCGTGTIKFNNNSTSNKTFIGASKTYYNFWNATTGTGTTTIQGNNTFNDFRSDAGRSMIITTLTTQTVTTFTCTGTAGNLITFTSSSNGQRYYFKCTTGTINCDYLSIRDFGAVGGATWNMGANTTNVSGNYGWASITDTERYWVAGGTGYWDDTSNWSLTDGGASGATAPVGQNVHFTANSGTGDVIGPFATLSRNLDFTGYTGSVMQITSVIYGDLTIPTGCSWLTEGTLSLRNGNFARTVTTNGQTILGGINVDGIQDTISLGDNLVCNGSITLTTGTLDASNNDVTFLTFARSLSSVNVPGTLTMGSGTWTMTGTSWSMSTNLSPLTTVNANTSTIKITDAGTQNKTFAGAGFTYNNIWMTGSGTGWYNFQGSNTFNDFKIDTPPHTVTFTAGTTTTVTTFTVSGTSGNLMTIGSATAATHTLAKAGGGKIGRDYLSISNSTATPSTTWYAGTHSTNGGGNSGWTFTDAPSGVNSNFFFY
jgi:hypothetical protein